MNDSSQEETIQSAIPHWTPDFDVNSFDLQTVFREAKAQKKSAYKVLKAAGYPVAKYLAQEVVEVKAADGTVPATASSTAIDLSGDDFALSAIEQMQAVAKGSTVFLNHSYDLPEDVYGKIADCSIQKRDVFSPIAGETQNLSCWDLNIQPVGEDENPRAVRVTNMLQKSKLKLGVSVTVLILESKKRADGGRTITKIFYIESSMVGIPCNQTAWSGTAKSARASNDQLGHTVFSPLDMSDPTSIEKFRQELTAWLGVSGLASNKEQVMHTNNPAQPVGDSTGTATSPLSFNEVQKAMFAEVLDDNQNNFWMYISSLSTVVNRILRDVRGKDAEAQAEAVAEGEASFDEFVATLKEWFPKEVAEEAAKEKARDYWWEYYSAIGRVRDVVQKAGARNSTADQELIRKAHDCMKELCPEVCGVDGEAGGTGDEAKSASVASTELESKAAELETKVAALEIAQAELQKQLDAALDAAEKAAELLELEKATSLAAVEALEQYSVEPLPRAGTQSVS